MTLPMKLLQKRSVAVMVMIAAIVTGIVFGQLRKPDPADQASTAVVGTYTYVYDHAHVPQMRPWPTWTP